MSKIYKNMSIYLMLYIVLQPILDVITGFSIKSGASPVLTVGIVVRMLVMVLAAGYVIYNKNQLKYEDYKKLLIYISILSVLVVINLGTSFMLKPLFSVKAELSAIAKTLYFIVMLIAYIIAFKDLLRSNFGKQFFPKMTYYAMMIVDFVMIVAHFTHTNFNAYKYMKAGESGWFFAANEIGSLLAIALPLVILYVVQNSKSWKQWYYWIGLVATIYACLLLGTKVGVFAIIGTLAVAVIVSLAKVIMTRGKNKRFIVLFILFVLATGGVKLAYPKMAASQNIAIQKQFIKQQRQQQKYLKDLKHKKKSSLTKDEKKYLKKMTAGEKEVIEGDEVKDTTKSLIFSSRTVYLDRLQNYYNKAPLMQKIFGMGVGGNYEKEPKTAEMDYFDLFYEYGIVGFIIVIIPLLLSLLSIAIYTVKHIRIIFTFKYAMMLSSVGLGVSIALISGHVLMAPAVSIYLVTVLAYLLVDYKKRNINEKNIEID